MARGSRHAVVAAAYLLLCEKEHRQALGAKSERNALVRSAGERRRSSRAAMWAGGDGWMAARRFSHFGQEPMNRRRGRGRAGVFGGGPSIFSYGQNQRIWADGHLTPRVILLFLERSFEPPAQLMLAQPERGGRQGVSFRGLSLCRSQIANADRRSPAGRGLQGEAKGCIALMQNYSLGSCNLQSQICRFTPLLHESNDSLSAGCRFLFLFRLQMGSARWYT